MRALVFAFFGLYLAGCATIQAPVPLSKQAFSTDTTIGVYLSETPAPKTHFDGASCLLCIAFASGSNSKLTAQVLTLGAEELNDLGQSVVNKLQAQGKNATLITKQLALADLKKHSGKHPNSTPRSFSELADVLGVSHLAVISVDRLGVMRNYQGYVPTGAPVGYVDGSAYLVDLKNNQYSMYTDIVQQSPVEGEWKEPPTYPGVSTAFYQALEATKDTVIQAFTITEAAPPAE